MCKDKINITQINYIYTKDAHNENKKENKKNQKRNHQKTRDNKVNKKNNNNHKFKVNEHDYHPPSNHKNMAQPPHKYSSLDNKQNKSYYFNNPPHTYLSKHYKHQRKQQQMDNNLAFNPKNQWKNKNDDNNNKDNNKKEESDRNHQNEIQQNKLNENIKSKKIGPINEHHNCVSNRDKMLTLPAHWSDKQKLMILGTTIDNQQEIERNVLFSPETSPSVSDFDQDEITKK